MKKWIIIVDNDEIENQFYSIREIFENADIVDEYWEEMTNEERECYD